MGENSPNLVNLRQMLRGETRTKKTDEKKLRTRLRSCIHFGFLRLVNSVTGYYLKKATKMSPKSPTVEPYTFCMYFYCKRFDIKSIKI
jgi:hypothetical protein